MMTSQDYLAASKIGVSITLPELEKDIDAQLRCLADPEHPKRAVFLAIGNTLGNRNLPPCLFVESRPEGILVTDSALMAASFMQADFVTDEMLAEYLGYPEAKPSVLESGGGVVVQAIDKDGCVIFEAASSQRMLRETIDAAERQISPGGHVSVVSPLDALARRVAGMN